MGALNPAGRDKVTFVVSPRIASFGDWVEQLIAESTGKEGKGILPVVGEELGESDVYEDDRHFRAFTLGNDDDEIPALKELSTCRSPSVCTYD